MVGLALGSISCSISGSKSALCVSTKHQKIDIVGHFLLWFLYFVAEFVIIWAYNIWNGDTSFGAALHWILKNSEWTVTIPTIVFLCCWHLHKKNFTKNIVNIMVLIIVTHAFVYSDLDDTVFSKLWNELGYPAESIRFDSVNIPSVDRYLVNIPPVDPYQIPMLFFISLCKDLCEAILGRSIRRMNFGKHFASLV